MFVGCSRGRWVHWCAPWGSWVFSASLVSLGYALGGVGLFGVVGFIGVRPWCRRVRSVSLVEWSAPWVSSGSLGVTAFSVVRPGGRWVRSGSEWCALEWDRWVHYGAPWGSPCVAGFSGVRSGGRRVGFGQWVAPFGSSLH